MNWSKFWRGLNALILLCAGIYILVTPHAADSPSARFERGALGLALVQVSFLLEKDGRKVGEEA